MNITTPQPDPTKPCAFCGKEYPGVGRWFKNDSYPYEPHFCSYAHAHSYIGANLDRPFRHIEEIEL